MCQSTYVQTHNCPSNPANSSIHSYTHISHILCFLGLPNRDMRFQMVISDASVPTRRHGDNHDRYYFLPDSLAWRRIFRRPMFGQNLHLIWDRSDSNLRGAVLRPHHADAPDAHAHGGGHTGISVLTSFVLAMSKTSRRLEACGQQAKGT